MNDRDRQLVSLLAERVRALAAGEAGAESPDLAACLQEANLPAYVWEHLDTACKAAAAEVRHAKTNPAQTPRTVVIVGATGVMGRLYQGRLEAHGHKVCGLGRANWDTLADTVAAADLVLISVPIDKTSQIIREVGAALSRDTVLADLTSMKTPYVAEMLAAHSGAVVGLHPLFGPGVDSFLSQRVVVCHGRESEAYQWFLDFTVADGATLVESSPEEHDRLMVTIQAIRHFSTFSLGVFLAAEGVNIPRSLEFASPNYRLEIDLVGRLFAQDSNLYTDIMLATQERRETIMRLAETFTRLAEQVSRRDRGEIKNAFAKTRDLLGDETTRAIKESDRIIQALSMILAAAED